MDLGLATAVATGAGVYYVYGEKGKVAAASAVATGIVLYAAYYCKLKANPKINGFMSGGKKTNNLANWKPLSSEEIQQIKNKINPIEIVSNP